MKRDYILLHALFEKPELFFFSILKEQILNMPPKSSAAPKMPAKAPPAAQKFDKMDTSDANTGMAAVMNELVGGAGISLKKVSDDMKTKNRCPTDINPSVPVKVVTPKPVTLPATLLAPVCEIQRSNWVVENYVNHPSVLTLTECDMKQLVYISKCVNTTIHVDCKVKSITLDGCKQVNLIVHSVISSVELVNSDRCKVQAVHELPSLCIDKCSGVSVTLSDKSLECEFTTSKSSEMNVSVPIGTDGDYKELPIPEQYVHKVNTSGQISLHTSVSSLYH